MILFQFINSCKKILKNIFLFMMFMTHSLESMSL